MGYKGRSLAVVDVETTGHDERVHEILEIGLLVVRPDSFEVLDTGNWKIKPHTIQNAVPAALERNGYNERDWKDAVELKDVMPTFSEKTRGAIFTAFNVSFDWAFIHEAFRKTGVPNLMDYHRFDVLTLAWGMAGEKLEWLNLKSVSEFFNVPPEPDVHRAINGAETALAVMKKIKNMKAQTLLF